MHRLLLLPPQSARPASSAARGRSVLDFPPASAAARCRSILSHPAVPVKVGGSSGGRRALRRCRSSSSSSADALGRQADGVARMYARRTLEMAALAAANAAAAGGGAYAARAAARMDAKPEEWGTVDLEARRREFGESVSSLGETKVERVWAAGSRIASLALLASPLALLVPLAYLTGPNSRTTDAAWEYAIWSIEKAGPTFIKLVQWATTRNDLFPAEFVSKFARLQDDTRGHSWGETVSILEDAYGPDYADLLSFLDAEDGDQQQRKSGARRRGEVRPIGSGCVAQVYRARLRRGTSLHPAGTEVAVKVTHPRIVHKVCVDFYIMNKLTALLEAIPRLNLDYLSMRDSVEQFRDIMLPQLDLRVEARNLKRFRRDFQGDGRVSFPAPIGDLTTDQVLVESFVHGEPILEFMRSPRATKKDREDLATVGLETVMKMIFLYDFVHADLHPGNIIVDRNTDARGKPLRLNMIDCGLVVELGQRDHENLVRILGALVKRRGLEAGQLMVDTAKKCQASELDVKLFCRGIQKICDDDAEQNFLESVGDYLADICYLACRHKVKLEAAFINAALACEIMEGIASSLYPEMAVQRIALPMVARAEMMHMLHLK